VSSAEGIAIGRRTSSRGMNRKILGGVRERVRERVMGEIRYENEREMRESRRRRVEEFVAEGEKIVQEG
jgi:hypothetical protein